MQTVPSVCDPLQYLCHPLRGPDPQFGLQYDTLLHRISLLLKVTQLYYLENQKLWRAPQSTVYSPFSLFFVLFPFLPFGPEWNNTEIIPPPQPRGNSVLLWGSAAPSLLLMVHVWVVVHRRICVKRVCQITFEEGTVERRGGPELLKTA